MLYWDDERGAAETPACGRLTPLSRRAGRWPATLKSARRLLNGSVANSRSDEPLRIRVELRQLGLACTRRP